LLLTCAALCVVQQSYPTAGGNSVVQHREQQSYLGKDQPWPQLATAAMTAMVVSLDLIELAREVRGPVALPSNVALCWFWMLQLLLARNYSWDLINYGAFINALESSHWYAIHCRWFVS
jgi:hypothetical protein